VDEDLVSYTTRFKSARDLVKGQLGGSKNIVLERYINVKKAGMKSPPPFDEMAQEAYQELLARIFILNADQSKYGTFVKNLHSQFSLGNNQYPNTLTEAVSVLNSQELDQAYFDKKKKRKEQEKEKNQKSQDDGEPSIDMSFAQMEGKCFCCGKTDHKSPECPDKSKPKSEWVINKNKKKNVQHMQKASGDNNKDVGNGGCGWSAQQCELSLAQLGDGMREIILLDTESTCDLFCNADLVVNIQKAEEPLRLATNAGEILVYHTAEVPEYGRVWFHSEAMTNVFSFANMKKKHRITCDTDEEDALLVHTKNGITKFHGGPENLYYFKPKYRTGTQFQFVETVHEND
jgi:hypothetical protein